MATATIVQVGISRPPRSTHHSNQANLESAHARLPSSTYRDCARDTRPIGARSSPSAVSVASLVVPDAVGGKTIGRRKGKTAVKVSKIRLGQVCAVGALTVAGVGLVGQPTEASMACPNGFAREPVTVFSSAHRNRLTGGRASNGQVCLFVKKPTATGCGIRNNEAVYVFAAAHLTRLTANGTKMRAGKTCISVQKPGSTLWDPIAHNPSAYTIRTGAKSETRPQVGYSSPYRTINNTSVGTCRGQCQIRARCEQYDYNTKTRKCRMWTRGGSRPYYNPDSSVGLKSLKTNVQHPPQPQAARQFTRLVRKVASGRTPFHIGNVPSWEACTRRCIDTKPGGGHGTCLAVTMAPGSGGMKVCKMYDGSVTVTTVNAPSSTRNQFIYGKKIGKSHDR